MTPKMPKSIQTREVPSGKVADWVKLENSGNLSFQFSQTGNLCAIRKDGILINQVLANALEPGLNRIFVRERTKQKILSVSNTIDCSSSFHTNGNSCSQWKMVTASRLDVCTSLIVHPSLSAWAWKIEITNNGKSTAHIDCIMAQDLGLAEETGVRRNEAYNSHYIDMLPVKDERRGWTIFSRQNEATSKGEFPWLASACEMGSVAYATDSWQLYGTDHRLSHEAIIGSALTLESGKFQYESSMAALQSDCVEVAPGQTTECIFIQHFLDDHPAASSQSDVEFIEQLYPLDWVNVDPDAVGMIAEEQQASLFMTAALLDGFEASESQVESLFPGSRRWVEKNDDGELLSFFHGKNTHVVTRRKESLVFRPHGHVMRTGNAQWVDDEQLGVTCYATGIFGAQIYLGNPNFNRFFPVIRDGLNVIRSSGQRIFIKIKDQWCQLGLPTFYTITPERVKWIYLLEEHELEISVWCSDHLSNSYLKIRVLEGSPCEWMISSQLALGENEGDTGGTVRIDESKGLASFVPGESSLMAQQIPNAIFGISTTEVEDIVSMGGEELLGIGNLLPRDLTRFFVIKTRALEEFQLVMSGSIHGIEGIQSNLKKAANDLTVGQPVPFPLELSGSSDPGIGKVNEIVPWFNHNASIHFSAPHGLEQYGGAAWGVRDVCQGSLEWLLAAERFATAKKLLLKVFSQQYLEDGSWPQWFMHGPYSFIKQRHSHGDICFWVMKALCDYIESTHDFTILEVSVGYLDNDGAEVSGAYSETIIEHCDRILRLFECRVISNTSLVNYGEGDWDDTLQPADPELRTNMVSAWTVALTYQVFSQFREVCHRYDDSIRESQYDSLLTRIRDDFRKYLIVGGVAAGFLVREGTQSRLLLHPSDEVTGIRYRLLPMTRAILAELFSAEEAKVHLEIIKKELLFDDGVRLMSEPATYVGGKEQLFKRADTAANVGREIGLMYIHAHIRYAEALAKTGDADGMWRALQVVNPVDLKALVPQATERQANVFFSSSDADFSDRYEAREKWGDLKNGKIKVKGGWRLYSSGPGLFLNKIRTCMLGIREYYDEVVFDPVLPHSLDGLEVEIELLGRSLNLSYVVKEGVYAPKALWINGEKIDIINRCKNPYRKGGISLSKTYLESLLSPEENSLIFLL